MRRKSFEQSFGVFKLGEFRLGRLRTNWHSLTAPRVLVSISCVFFASHRRRTPFPGALHACKMQAWGVDKTKQGDKTKQDGLCLSPRR